MANTKISALTANTNPNWSEEFVYAYNNANGKITLNTMKAFIGSGSGSVTTLSADANIWELEEGTYVTTYNLYYKSWEIVPTITSTWSSRKQMLFVSKESTGERGFLTFNVWHKNTYYIWRASFGYSISSSEWEIYELGEWDDSLKQYRKQINTSLSHPEWLSSDSLTQIVYNINNDASNAIEIASQYPPYVWVPYTIVIASVESWKTYSITLGTWVTNPLGFTLPTNSNKGCVITAVATSTTTAIITGCTIWN